MEPDRRYGRQSGRRASYNMFWAHRQNTCSAGESPGRSMISSSMLAFATYWAAGHKHSLLRTARGLYPVAPSIATMLNR